MAYDVQLTLLQPEAYNPSLSSFVFFAHRVAIVMAASLIITFLINGFKYKMADDRRKKLMMKRDNFMTSDGVLLLFTNKGTPFSCFATRQ